MFGELGFIDWIALAFAAFFLAGAAAAAVLAYITNRANVTTSNDAPPPPKRPEASSAEEPVATPLAAHAPRHAKAPLQTAVIDLRSDSADQALTHRSLVKTAATPSVNRATPEPMVTAEARLAERAARLRGRPAAEPVADDRKRVVSAREPERTPAHAKTVAYAADHRPEDAKERSSSKGFPSRTPGFFEDPVGRHELRYWDGARWTEYVKERGERFTDPL